MKRSLDSGVSLAGRFGVSDQQRMTAFHPASIHWLSLRLPGPSLSQLKLALVSRLHTTDTVLTSPHCSAWICARLLSRTRRLLDR